MPYVKFICVKCGYKWRCEAKCYADGFKDIPAPPLCFEGKIDKDGNDVSVFEYVGCDPDEV